MFTINSIERTFVLFKRSRAAFLCDLVDTLRRCSVPVRIRGAHSLGCRSVPLLEAAQSAAIPARRAGARARARHLLVVPPEPPAQPPLPLALLLSVPALPARSTAVRWLARQLAICARRVPRCLRPPPPRSSSSLPHNCPR